MEIHARMAFLHRFCRRPVTSHRLRISSSQILGFNHDAAADSLVRVKEGSFASFITGSCGGARFSTAASEAPLINEKIRVPEVRLVTDMGHFVVSCNEALSRAKQLKLDLVMVQKNASPPVCKIMDFHREKYNLEVKNKDRAKSQQGVTLRKGDCKEVRFSVGIEAKDLKMKANTAKRLMDRGYRVRCVATGKEDKDLGGLLSRLTELIEDVSVIESGPRIEKQSAYVIVRHIKFGPSKKSGVQKKSRDKPRAESEDYSDSGLEAEVEEVDTPSEDEEEPLSPRIETKGDDRGVKKHAWSLNGDAGDLDNVFNMRINVDSNPNASVSSRLSSDVPSVFPKPGPQPPIEPENRYKRSPMGTNNRYPPPRPPLQGSREFPRPDPRAPARVRWPSRPDSQASLPADQREGSNPVLRSPRLQADDAMRRQMPRTDPSQPTSSSYGIFSPSNK